MQLSRSLYPAWFALLAIALACGDPSPPAPGSAVAEENPPAPAREGPPGARWDVVDMLREARDLQLRPLRRRRARLAGAGRAREAPRLLSRPLHDRLRGGPAWGRRGRHDLPAGVALLGLEHAADLEAPTLPGYTEVTTEAEGVELEAGTLDQQLLGIQVGGRPLEAGERVRIVYGAGSAGAIADSYAEKRARFWIAVDGDGDGVRKVLADSPSVEVRRGASGAAPRHATQSWAARARRCASASRSSTRREAAAWKSPARCGCATTPASSSFRNAWSSSPRTRG